jgi:hypothetical protein
MRSLFPQCAATSHGHRGQNHDQNQRRLATASGQVITGRFVHRGHGLDQLIIRRVDRSPGSPFGAPCRGTLRVPLRHCECGGLLKTRIPFWNGPEKSGITIRIICRPNRRPADDPPGVAGAYLGMIRALLEANDESGMWLSLCKDSKSRSVLH